MFYFLPGLHLGMQINSLNTKHNKFCPIVQALYRCTSVRPYSCMHTYIRGRVSKQVTNGSKTAVTDVIGFLCVSLGSRRACAYSYAGFSSKNVYSGREVCYRRAAFCGQKNIHKEMFLFAVGSVCRIKRFATESRNSLVDHMPLIPLNSIKVINSLYFLCICHWPVSHYKELCPPVFYIDFIQYYNS
jgi:hypothetical protein